MEYAWWWIVWLLVFAVLLWVAFRRDPARQGRYRGGYRSLKHHGADQPLVSQWAGGEHEGRGPRGYRRSDRRIAEDVSDALTLDGDVDASDVAVETRDGHVALKGTVASRGQKRVAAAIAESVPGVTGVDNGLRVVRARRRAA